MRVDAPLAQIGSRRWLVWALELFKAAIGPRLAGDCLLRGGVGPCRAKIFCVRRVQQRENNQTRRFRRFVCFSRGSIVAERIALANVASSVGCAVANTREPFGRACVQGRFATVKVTLEACLDLRIGFGGNRSFVAGDCLSQRGVGLCGNFFFGRQKSLS